MRRVDLHCHTVVSDGTLTPTQLVEHAAAQDLAAIALTDHDHVGGLAEARRAGARLGVDVLSGIELSCLEDGHDVHLLGYLVRDEDASFLARLEELRAVRERRAALMLERLAAAGVELDPALLAAEVAAGGAIGRPHVARALMKAGVVGSIREAFDRYLAEGRPAFVPKAKLTATEGIALVHAAGGVAVLAHPVTLPEGMREGLVRRLAAAGLDGIEVVHSKHSAVDRAVFGGWAQEHGLIATGGSDFHGENKPEVQLGSGKDGNVDVREDLVGALRTRALHGALRRG